jgi:hypothetical protein
MRRSMALRCVSVALAGKYHFSAQSCPLIDV